VNLALTTRWNARRHPDGAAMVEEILALGFDRIELGYDTRAELTAGVRRMADEGAVAVDSLHNFCPLPLGAARPHPEIYTFAHPDRSVREKAVTHTMHTISFAAEVGARIVVSHSGNVVMRSHTRELIQLAEQGQQGAPRYHRVLESLRNRRDAKAAKQFPWLVDSLERLMPALEANGIQLGLENMPTWEGFPTEHEMERLLNHFGSAHLRYWHDVGHGQIRQNLGLVNVDRWLERLGPSLGGLHIHDVIPPGRDHIMPPRGRLDFQPLARYVQGDIPLVIEPKPGTPKEQIVEAKRWLEAAWDPSLIEPHARTPISKESNP
jgi:sugar phosphate isomerase/epimerase